MAFPPPSGPEDERTELIDFMGTKYPFKVAVPPPERFDPAKARADTAALASGSLTPGLEPGTRAAAASTRALDELALGIRPDQVLKDWQAGLPERGAPAARPGTAAGLAERMDASMTPLLEGVRAELTRQAAAQRGHEDKLAAVAWLNQGARLAARAPGGLAEATASKLGEALSDPGMGKIFLDKVAYYRVLGDLERDAGRDLAEDPRLAGVAPEIREDLEGDRRRLAREQGLSRQVAAARGRAAFSQGLAGAFTAARRGEAGPAYAREQFLALYGAREGEARWQAYQASQAKAPAYALVRGRSQEEIAAAKAGYGGDHTLLAQVEAEDAAERRRDPAGYGLAWAPGARAAYDQAGDPGEQAAILWEAQGQAGIPEGERSPWSGESATALAEGWLAIPDGPGAAKARIDLLRQDLLSLPPEQRAAGQATLERMLSTGTAPGPLGSIVAALEDNRLGDAYAAAATTQPTTKDTPGLVQLADSGEIASDADPAPLASEAPTDTPPLSAEDAAWVATAARQPDESLADWSRRLGQMIAAEGSDHDLAALLALQSSILDALDRESGGDPDERLMLAQGLAPDAWQRAEAADAETQREHDDLSAFNQAIYRDRNGFFLGPEGRLYRREEALVVGLELPGSLQNLDGEIAAAWTREAAATGQFGDLAEQNPEAFVEAMLRSIGGGRGGEIGLAMPLPSIALAGNWRGAAAGTLLGGKVLLTKPGGSLPEPTPLIGRAKLPANAYAGGKPGLRGRPQRYDPEIKQWGQSTFTPKNPDLNRGLEPTGKSEPRRGRNENQVRDLDAQDEAARILGYAGFEVQTRDHGAGGGPDYLIDGVEYEHYRITTRTPASAFNKIKDKIDNRQGQRFVVQLGEGTGFTLEEFRSYLQQWGKQPSRTLCLPAQQIVAIDASGDIVVLWP